MDPLRYTCEQCGAEPHRSCVLDDDAATSIAPHPDRVLTAALEEIEELRKAFAGLIVERNHLQANVARLEGLVDELRRQRDAWAASHEGTAF